MEALFCVFLIFFQIFSAFSSGAFSFDLVFSADDGVDDADDVS